MLRGGTRGAAREQHRLGAVDTRDDCEFAFSIVDLGLKVLEVLEEGCTLYRREQHLTEEGGGAMWKGVRCAVKKTLFRSPILFQVEE